MYVSISEVREERIRTVPVVRSYLELKSLKHTKDERRRMGEELILPISLHST